MSTSYVVLTTTRTGIDWLAEAPTIEIATDAMQEWIAQPDCGEDDRAWVVQVVASAKGPNM